MGSSFKDNYIYTIDNIYRITIEDNYRKCRTQEVLSTEGIKGKGREALGVSFTGGSFN